MGAASLLIAAGAFGGSLTGAGASVPRKACIAACIGGIFLWNYYGGDPSQLAGLGRERFEPVNAKQREELANGGETSGWKRLSLNGLFRRSSMQALLGAVSGGSAWITWAVGSAYTGPGEKVVRRAALGLMLTLSAFAGWTMTHDFRKRIMGLDEAGDPI